MTLREKKAEYFAEVLHRILKEPALDLKELADIIRFELGDNFIKELIKTLKRKI